MPRALRIFYVFLISVFISGCATVAQKEVTFLETGERLISVCVLNDAYFPVEEHIVSETLHEVFREYRVFAKIVFQKEPTQMFLEDFDTKPLEKYAAKVWRDCKNKSEIKILFSNREITVADFPSIKNQDVPLNTPQIGVAIEDLGIILLYMATHQWNNKDLGGNKALVTTLKHEIGHCFGLVHVVDQQSFMYASIGSSFGKWTSYEIIGIRKNNRKIWYAP